MHWKVKALSAVIAINFILLAGIGLALWLTRPSSEDDGDASAAGEPARTPPAEVPPLLAPEDPQATQP